MRLKPWCPNNQGLKYPRFGKKIIRSVLKKQCNLTGALWYFKHITIEHHYCSWLNQLFRSIFKFANYNRLPGRIRKWSFIVNLPLKHGDFPVRHVNVYWRVSPIFRRTRVAAVRNYCFTMRNTLNEDGASPGGTLVAKVDRSQLGDVPAMFDYRYGYLVFMVITCISKMRFCSYYKYFFWFIYPIKVHFKYSYLPVHQVKRAST